MTIASIAACLVVLLAPTMTGCDLRGCVCEEMLVIKRTVQDEKDKETKQFHLGNEQNGEVAVIDMKIPANMNATLCLC